MRYLFIMKLIVPQVYLRSGAKRLGTAPEFELQRPGHRSGGTGAVPKARHCSGLLGELEAWAIPEVPPERCLRAGNSGVVRRLPRPGHRSGGVGRSPKWGTARGPLSGARGSALLRVVGRAPEAWAPLRRYLERCPSSALLELLGEPQAWTPLPEVPPERCPGLGTAGLLESSEAWSPLEVPPERCLKQHCSGVVGRAPEAPLRRYLRTKGSALLRSCWESSRPGHRSGGTSDQGLGTAPELLGEL